MALAWVKCFDGYASFYKDVPLKLRGPLTFLQEASRGKRRQGYYWLYVRNNRYSSSGKYDDAVSFKTVASGKKYVEGLIRRGVLEEYVGKR